MVAYSYGANTSQSTYILAEQHRSMLKKTIRAGSPQVTPGSPAPIPRPNFHPNTPFHKLKTTTTTTTIASRASPQRKLHHACAYYIGGGNRAGWRGDYNNDKRVAPFILSRCHAEVLCTRHRHEHVKPDANTLL